MIQRILYTALANGLRAVQADPTLLDELFGDLYGLSQNEVAKIKQYFGQTTFTITHAYPRDTAKAPIYSIVLQSEAQSDWFLGEDMGTLDEGGDLDGCDQVGAVWTHNYQILCYAQNPDTTAYMYEIAKQAMHSASGLFIDQCLMEWQFSGMDLAPDPRYVPEDLFCRAFAVSCKREFIHVDRASRLGKAFAVDGIATPPGAGQDDGGALTLVTPIILDGTTTTTGGDDDA